MRPNEKEKDSGAAAVRAFRQSVRTLTDPTPGLWDSFLRYETWGDLTPELPLLEFSPFGGMADVASGSEPNASGEGREGSRRPQAERPVRSQPPTTPGASRPTGPPARDTIPSQADMPQGTIPTLSLRQPHRQSASPSAATAHNGGHRPELAVPHFTNAPLNDRTAVDQIAEFVEALLPAKDEAGTASPEKGARRTPGFGEEPPTSPSLERRRLSASPLAGPGGDTPGAGRSAVPGSQSAFAGTPPASASPPSLSADVTLTMARIQTLANALFAVSSPRDSVDAASNARKHRLNGASVFPASVGGDAPAIAGALPPMRSETRPMSAEAFQSAQGERANADSVSRSSGAGRELSDKEEALMAETLLTPEQLAERVNEALVEQARRHGVDLV